MTSIVTTMIIGALIVLTFMLLRCKYLKEKKRAELLQRIDSDIISLFKLKTYASTVETSYQSTMLFSRINSFILEREYYPGRVFKEEYKEFLSEDKSLAFHNVNVSLSEEQVEERRENAKQYISYIISALERCRKEVIYT